MADSLEVRDVIYKDACRTHYDAGRRQGQIDALKYLRTWPSWPLDASGGNPIELTFWAWADAALARLEAGGSLEAT